MYILYIKSASIETFKKIFRKIQIIFQTFNNIAMNQIQF